MSHVTLLNLQGLTVVRTQFPGEADLAGLRAILGETAAAYAALPRGSILSLVEFGPRDFDGPVIDLMEAAARANAGTVKATSFLGVPEEQRPLFRALIAVTGRKASLQPDQDSALKWLAEAAAADDDPLAGF